MADLIFQQNGASDARSPPAWVLGMAALPFGLVNGFTGLALPFLLGRQGVPVDVIASVMATVFSPMVWGILLQPVLDTGWSRQVYSYLLLIVAAVGLALGFATLTPGHLRLSSALLIAANLSIVLYGGCVQGWISEVAPNRVRGAIGGWINVANIGGGSLGSMVIMALVSRGVLQRQTLSVAIVPAVLLSGLPLLWFPAARQPILRLRRALIDTPKAIWITVRQRRFLLGIALFLLPAGSTAAAFLLPGLGKDFHASEGTVIAATGLGVAITASLGALAGGWLSDRFPRARVFLFASLGAGTMALAVALVLPRSAAVFIAMAFLYNGLQGPIYAAYDALSLELTGETNPIACTQIALFRSAFNASVTYMTVLDGVGYKRGGVRGLFLVDGLACFAAVAILFWLVRPLWAKDDAVPTTLLVIEAA